MIELEPKENFTDKDALIEHLYNIIKQIIEKIEVR